MTRDLFQLWGMVVSKGMEWRLSMETGEKSS